MEPFKPLSVVDQLVAHLRGAITRGELGGSMPAIRRLAGALEVSSNTVTAALARLAGEEFLQPQGHGRRSRIILPKDFARKAFRVTLLPSVRADIQQEHVLEIRRRLTEEGYDVSVAEKSLVDFGVEVGRIAVFDTQQLGAIGTPLVFAGGALRMNTGILWTKMPDLNADHPVSFAPNKDLGIDRRHAVSFEIDNPLNLGTGGSSIEGTTTADVILSQDYRYSGPTSLTGGVTSVETTGNLGLPASNLVFNGGILKIGGTALTSFSTIGHTVVSNAAGAHSLDVSGTVSSGGSLAVRGRSTLNLEPGANWTQNRSMAVQPLNSGYGATMNVRTGAIGTSGVLQLTFAGTDTVDKLFIGATQQAAGVYGHSSTGETNGGLAVCALDARFAEGSGMLTVQGVKVAMGGSLDLAPLASTVEETVLNPGPPGATSGYEWHTFRLSDAISGHSRGFLRASFSIP